LLRFRLHAALRQTRNDGSELMRMAKRAPDATDRRVGARVRMRRLILNMSQPELAAALGLSFQQVQKYEIGSNRIGAGRLQQLAGILEVPVSFFFEDFPAAGRKQSALPSYVSDFLTDADGLALSRAFMSLRDARQRRCLVILAEAMAR
jgi:transcriptional regulator with XRE-family HTH domain